MKSELSKARPSVAIAGATGAVGKELVSCLEKRRFPVSHLRLLASQRSAGRALPFRGRDLQVETLDAKSFAGIDIVLFATDSDTAITFVPIAVEVGAIAIDNSSAFRLDRDVPLVIPEINPAEIWRHSGIIANPNCVAIVAITPLWPIHRRNPVKRLVLSTYQAASGAGTPAMEELFESTRAFVEGRSFEPKALPHPYAFNVFSHDTKIDLATGYNAEESKVMAETKKILGAPEMLVSATCIRVPVMRAHCISLTFECARPISADEVRTILSDAPGVKIVDDRERNYFPMPKDATGQDEILVGRIRQDVSDSSGRSIAWFAAGDQLLKGAALNAVQIAEIVIGGSRSR
jgi:aspartate-semialdehyde dehydrogenase